MKYFRARRIIRCRWKRGWTSFAVRTGGTGGPSGARRMRQFFSTEYLCAERASSCLWNIRETRDVSIMIDRNRDFGKRSSNKFHIFKSMPFVRVCTSVYIVVDVLMYSWFLKLAKNGCTRLSRVWDPFIPHYCYHLHRLQNTRRQVRSLIPSLLLSLHYRLSLSIRSIFFNTDILHALWIAKFIIT